MGTQAVTAFTEPSQAATTDQIATPGLVAPKVISASISVVNTPNDDDMTRIITEKNSETGLFVGWLVCVLGPQRGQDLHLRAGFNSIGRDETNNIRLSADEGLAPGSHAKIFFDSRNATFLLLSSRSDTPLQLNQLVLLQPTLLRPFDRIHLGVQGFVFVPLCGENFSWPKLPV